MPGSRALGRAGFTCWRQAGGRWLRCCAGAETGDPHALLFPLSPALTTKVASWGSLTSSNSIHAQRASSYLTNRKQCSREAAVCASQLLGCAAVACWAQAGRQARARREQAPKRQTCMASWPRAIGCSRGALAGFVAVGLLHLQGGQAGRQTPGFGLQRAHSERLAEVHLLSSQQLGSNSRVLGPASPGGLPSCPLDLGGVAVSSEGLPPTRPHD